MRLVVFTAALGTATDRVRPPLVIDAAVRYVCFSDQPGVTAPYEWIPVPEAENPRWAARQIKILADHPVLREASCTLWHDASYQLRRSLTWVPRALRHADVAALRHPSRTEIEAEAVAIARYGYVSLERAQAHVARYRRAGFTERVLTCTGLLARRVSSAVGRFNAVWWHEAQQWGGRDQASVDYAAWRTGVEIRHVLGTIRDNRYAGWRVRPEAVSA